MTESIPPASSESEGGEANNFDTFPLNQVSLPKLRQWLFVSFSIAELNALIFDLEIDIEEIAGDIKTARVVSLLDYVQRHNRLRDLLIAAKKHRPLLKPSIIQRTGSPDEADSHRVIEADQGLRAVQTLLDDPTVRAAMISFGNDFKTIEHDLRRLYSLKQIHELLQTLESQYSLLNNDQERLSDSDLWDNVSFTAPEIELLLSDLLTAAAADSLSGQDIQWTAQAARLQQTLKEAVEQTNRDALTAVTRNLFRFLNRQPTRINIQLVTTVRSLRLDTLANAMTTISTALAQTGQHSEATQQIDESISAFTDIEERVNALATDHDTWQQLDDELRQVEASLHQGLEEIEEAWFYLRQHARELYIEKDEEWATELTGLTKELDQALANRVIVTFKRQFRRYNTLANRRFHWVDRQLLALGRQLQQVGGSLNDLLRTLG